MNDNQQPNRPAYNLSAYKTEENKNAQAPLMIQTGTEDLTKQVAATTILMAPSDSTQQDLDPADPTPRALIAYESLRITDKTYVEPPTPIITIGGEIISTAGNITTISGPSKSGKSALTAPILAGAISLDGNIVDPFEQLQIKPNENAYAVIQIDTEQAKHKQQNNVKGIVRRAGLQQCPDHFLSYNFRSSDIEDYKPNTEEIFKGALAAYGGIHLAVIDGVADYIDNVNNAPQSNSIVKFFEGLAIKYKTTIIFIVHTNPGSDKERGHLGSQCQRKSESVLTIKNNGDKSYIVPKLLRMAGKGNVPQIAYCYDEDKGYHVSCGIMEDVDANKGDQRRDQLEMIAEAVFPAPVSLPYKAAIEAIMKTTGKKIATAKSIFTEMKTVGIIEQDEQKNWMLKEQVADEVFTDEAPEMDEEG